MEIQQQVVQQIIIRQRIIVTTEVQIVVQHVRHCEVTISIVQHDQQHQHHVI